MSIDLTIPSTRHRKGKSRLFFVFGNYADRDPVRFQSDDSAQVQIDAIVTCLKDSHRHESSLDRAMKAAIQVLEDKSTNELDSQHMIIKELLVADDNLMSAALDLRRMRRGVTSRPQVASVPDSIPTWIHILISPMLSFILSGITALASLRMFAVGDYFPLIALSVCTVAFGSLGVFILALDRAIKRGLPL